MSWVSSVRLKDYMPTLEHGTIDADDPVPVLHDNRMFRVSGLATTRTLPSALDLAGPYLLYDWRDHAGSNTIENQGVIDLGSSYDMTITPTTSSGGVDYQEAACVVNSPLIDWSALGGPPDESAFTFVAAMGGASGRTDVASNHQARFFVNGDVLFDCRVHNYTSFDHDAMVRWLVNSSADELKVDRDDAAFLQTYMIHGVIVVTLDLPTGDLNGLWINRSTIPFDTTRVNDYTSAPYPDYGTEAEPTIDQFEAYLARGIPATSSGAPTEGFYAMALYRGVPSPSDLGALQILYGTPN